MGNLSPSPSSLSSAAPPQTKRALSVFMPVLPSNVRYTDSYSRNSSITQPPRSPRSPRLSPAKFAFSKKNLRIAALLCSYVSPDLANLVIDYSDDLFPLEPEFKVNSSSSSSSSRKASSGKNKTPSHPSPKNLSSESNHEHEQEIAADGVCANGGSHFTKWAIPAGFDPRSAFVLTDSILAAIFPSDDKLSCWQLALFDLVKGNFSPVGSPWKIRRLEEMRALTLLPTGDICVVTSFRRRHASFDYEFGIIHVFGTKERTLIKSIRHEHRAPVTDVFVLPPSLFENMPPAAPPVTKLFSPPPDAEDRACDLSVSNSSTSSHSGGGAAPTISSVTSSGSVASPTVTHTRSNSTVRIDALESHALRAITATAFIISPPSSSNSPSATPTSSLSRTTAAPPRAFLEGDQQAPRPTTSASLR